MLELLRILLIEDDEDDFVLVRDLLSDVSPITIHLDWVRRYEDGLEEIDRARHDVYLLDYRLGAHDGLELLKEAVARGCRVPIIFLTGRGNYEVDVEAMKYGAADYLIKDQINAPLLERSIRYSIDRRKAEEAMRQSEKRLRRLSSQLLTAQEEERRRISRELHDSIGSSLSAIKFGLENVLATMEQRCATPDMLMPLVDMTQHAIDEARRMMSDLRPSMLDELGLIVTINWFCKKFQAVYSSISVERNIIITEDEIPGHLKIVIFRIVQEALHNVAKYSRARRVALAIAKADGMLTLSVEDQGVGFDLETVLYSSSHDRGLGLTSMKERAELSGGAFRIESAPGKGTKIRVYWRCE